MNITFSDEPVPGREFKQPSIFTLSSMFAIFPIHHHRKSKLNYLYLLYASIFIAALIASYVLRMLDLTQANESNTSKLLYAGYSFVNSSLGVICVIASITNHRHVKSILQGLSNADYVIRRIQPNFIFTGSNRRISVQVIFTISISLVFLFIYAAACRESTFPPFSNTEFYILPVTWLIVFQIDYFMVHLRERFTIINGRLESTLHDSTSSFPLCADTRMQPPLDLVTLNCVNEAHFSLYEIFTEIDNTYSVQLLVLLPRVIFFCILPTHYNIVTALVRSQNDEISQFWTHVFTLTHIVLLVSPVIYIINVAFNTVTEAKNIHTLIHDLIDEGQVEPLENELLIFSIQLLHRNIEFSVHEFFSMKPSLITTMFELIMTYVIILLQFQDTLASMSPIHLLLRPVQLVNVSSSDSEVSNDQLSLATMIPEYFAQITGTYLLNYTRFD